MAIARPFVNKPRYAFRAARKDDLELLRHWLNTPEVVRWWGDPAAQFALLTEDLDDPRMTMRVVEFEDRPLAYAQDYRIADWPQPHFASLPAGARAIDAFIGEPDMIGRGHGSQFLRLLANRLLHGGTPCVVIDPDANNVRARRAYQKAGFVGNEIVNDAAGDPVVIMTFDASNFGRAP